MKAALPPERAALLKELAPMTTPTDTPKAMTLPELRKFDGQLFIMNTTPMKITFREKLGDKSVDFRA